MAMWLCGYVANFLKSKFQQFKKFGTQTLQWNTNLYSHNYKNNIVLKLFPYVFLYVLEYFDIFKSRNTGSYGYTSLGIMEMLGFGPSINKTKVLSGQNGEE